MRDFNGYIKGYQKMCGRCICGLVYVLNYFEEAFFGYILMRRL